MDPLLLIVLGGALSLLAFLLIRGGHHAETPPMRSAARRPAASPRSPNNDGVSGASLAVPPPAADAASSVAIRVASASLREFEWHRLESLPPARMASMLSELKQTPPPPRAFHHLVSPDFVATASSAELAELVIGVPLAATQVLARVNSAFYGLPKPVSSLGHAITYLGLNSVRAICLQYMTQASFAAHAPALKHRFDQLWAASAIASELSHKLAHRLQVPEAGALVTEVALASLGHFSAAILMPREGSTASSQTLLARAWTEQAQLGVPAAEIGALLMRAWELPEPLVDDVRAIDRLLVTPAGRLEPHRSLRLAVQYLSVRLGERLARGDAVNLGDLDAGVLAGDDYFHLRENLQASQHLALREALLAPDIARSVQHMLATVRDPHAMH